MSDAMLEGTKTFVVKGDIRTLANGKKYVVFHNDYLEEFKKLPGFDLYIKRKDTK